MEVIVQDANNIVIEVDQGRQGRGVSSVSLVTVGADYYIQFTFTDGTTQQVGPIATTVTEVISAEVRNAEAVTILKGQPVYLFQAQGNLATVKLAYNTSDATSAKTLGLAAENIAPNAQGLVTCQGTLGGLNTSAYSEGDTLYLGATAGTLTNVKPQAPNHLVYIGVVERANAGAGQIYVRVQNGFELDEIHDVRIISPVNGNTLIYDASTSLWKNAGITAGSGINVTNGPASITVGNTGVLSFSGGTTGLTPATATTGAVTLAGTLSTANGGTGLSSFTANRVLYTSSTSAIGQSASFTFDGSTLALNGGTIGTRLAVKGTGAFVGFDTGSAADGRAEYAYNGTNIFYTGIDSATEFSLWGRTGVSLKFAANNSEQMRLTSTGLGIGNSAPNTKLDITTTANNGIRLFQTGAANAWNIYTSGNNLRFIEENVGTVMAINAGGNVGIGTTSPGASLQVGNGTGLRQALISGGGYDLFLGASGGSIFGFASQAISLVFNTAAVPLGIGTNASQPLIFGTSAAERMRLDSSGNLGIGTISPAGRLHVAQTNAGGAQFLTLQTTNSTQGNAVIRWQGSGATNQAFIGSYVNSADTGNLEFGNASSTTMQLTSTGNLGIGVTPGSWLGRALQISAYTSFAQRTGTSDGIFSWNALVTSGTTSGSGYVYRVTGDLASSYEQNGNHRWYVAPSGTAGNAITFTQAMTLNTSSQLLVGTTTNTNSSTVTAGGTISETVSSTQYLVASQFDVGTAPNKIPLNQYLGNLAYQNASAIAGQAGFSAGTAALPSIASATDLTTGRWFPAAGVMAWSTGGVERMRLDASGNLGLGVTPSASNLPTIQSSFGILSGNSQANIAANAYYTTQWNYISTAVASLYTQTVGQHRWFNAPSGTAGNAISFTQAMTLTAAGELGVGTTNPGGETIDVLAGVKSGQIVASTSTNNGFAAVVAAVRDGGENRRAGLYVDDSNATWGLASKYSTTGADFVLVNNNARAVTANLAGSVIIGSAAIATTATDGFFYIPTCAGAPTGTPTAQTGRAPLVVDSTNNRFYVYVNGSWKYAALV